ncbi:MAG: hypothetical protein JXA54_15915 [Candidatus Heimdallarchaeota archaeon]|nr:hypothetical protein [Candidatus Heimdallarchaeota archaeon]
MGNNIIFRLQEESDLSNSIKHWDDSVQYQAKQIDAIQSTNPESVKEPTSIPSPFARIALAKTAFGVVAKDWERASKAYLKIVSDCLDVAEIFFNYEKLKDKVQIMVWDRENNLKELLVNSNHKSFGTTLNMYLEQDAKGEDPYNFSKLQRIYLLNYIGPGKPSQLNIIGATSPATLFFSAANDLSYVSEHIYFGKDKPFDNSFQQLYERDFEFQKYLYAFKKSNHNFAEEFPEFDKYLLNEQGGKCNYNFLNDDQKNIIDKLDEKSIHEYFPLKIDNGSNVVEILGNPYHYRISPNMESDFEIDSDIYKGAKPLVLPIESGNTYTSLQYTQDKWHKEFKAPVFNKTHWLERTLPYSGDKYPYLTISDFLEESIIRLPYEISDQSYFNGNLDKPQGKGYLLPVKNLFFDFFNTSQLKKLINIKINAGGVTVKLRIPIKNHKYIEYSRNYFENNKPNIDEESNNGSVVENEFVFALFPNIKFANNEDAYYRFGIISDFQQSNNYGAKYYSRGIKETNLIIRNDNDPNYKQCKNYILENSNFDYIRINCSKNESGIIIPNFKIQGGTDLFTYAIDLGTTNTHIEYRVGDNGIALPFNIEEDKQIHSSSGIGSDNYIFDYDFLPERIGNKEEFKFPMRTALSESKSTNWDSVFPMAHANVPFPYEKRNEYKYNRILTGLKWSNDTDNMKKIRCYIDSLFLILRNKVILNNGDLSKTKIVWFYPISMTRSRFSLFKMAWEESYLKYFGKNLQNIIPVTESVAPYEYYKRQVTNASNMVSIDIGGGTTDIVFANNNGINFITSFRFAANSIFGDGYADNSINGIIRQFKNQIFDVLQSANLDDLLRIYDTLDKKNNSSDIASFFFSLKDNKEIRGKNLSDSVDFNKILQADETHKIIFVIFYVGIIYHLAHIMKVKNLPMPRHITFSGNGSKVVQILTTDIKLLEKFTIIIFEKIYEKKYDNDGLTILQNSTIPKEATCKGGISAPVAQDYDNIANTKVVLKSTDANTLVTNETYETINLQNYIESIIGEVGKFIHFVFDLNSMFSYRNNFGISNKSLQIAKEQCSKDLKTYTINGLNQKLKEVSGDDIIEETFFFYPLTGMLTALSAAITDNKNEPSKTSGYKVEELFDN